MPTYPTYHQNWDGGTGSYPPGYGDWNLNAIGGTSWNGFTVGGSGITSGSKNLVIATNTAQSPFWILSKNTAEASADGKATLYSTIASYGILGICARMDGMWTQSNQGKIYIANYYADPTTSNSYMQIYEFSTGVPYIPVTLSSTNYVVGNVMMIELRLSGTSIKIRLLDRTAGKWLHSDGTWSTTPAECITTTSSTITAAGRIGVLGMNGASDQSADDIFWDAPDPILSVSSQTMTIGDTPLSLTAGGFSDPLAGVTWSTSNSSVATVSIGSGPEDTPCSVTPVGGGTATITATGSADSGQSATCALTVNPVSRRRFSARIGSRSLAMAR